MSDASQEKKQVNVDVPPMPVTVHAQYVKDFSFENPNAPDSLRPSQARPEMSVNIAIDAARFNDGTTEDLYETTLTLNVKATREGKVSFLAELSYAALVSVKGVPEANIRSILYIDVPQMLFPFARQMVAQATGAGGFPPLMLNPVDFRGMYASQQSSREEIAQSA